MGVITVTGFEAASNTDVLNGTRLVTIEVGRVTIELQAADNVAANHYTVSLTLPDGSAPLLDVLVPGGATAGLAGILDSRLAYSATFKVTKSGHMTLSCVETGDTELFWRVTSSFVITT